MLDLRFVFFTEKRLKQAESEQKQHQNQNIFCIFQNQNGQFRCMKTVKQIHGQHDSAANQRNGLEVEFQFSGMCEIGQTENFLFHGFKDTFGNDSLQLLPIFK